MKSLSFVTILATTAFLLHGAALTACGSSGSGASTTTGTATGGGTTTTSGTTTHGTGGATTTTTATGGSGTGGAGTGGTGTGGMASDAGSDGGGSLCTQTGGTVTMVPCTCSSQGDFPSTCAIGGCTCAPGSTHMIKSCTCGASKCYDPTLGCITHV